MDAHRRHSALAQRDLLADIQDVIICDITSVTNRHAVTAMEAHLLPCMDAINIGASFADTKLHVAAVDAAALYPRYTPTSSSAATRDRTPDAELVQRHPTLIVEVRSDGTAAFDRGEKFEACRSLEALTAYVLLDQRLPRADVFLCDAHGRWLFSSVRNGDVMALPLLGIALKMAAAYAGVAHRVAG